MSPSGADRQGAASCSHRCPRLPPGTGAHADLGAFADALIARPDPPPDLPLPVRNLLQFTLDLFDTAPASGVPAPTGSARPPKGLQRNLKKNGSSQRRSSSDATHSIAEVGSRPRRWRTCWRRPASDIRAPTGRSRSRARGLPTSLGAASAVPSDFPSAPMVWRCARPARSRWSRWTPRCARRPTGSCASLAKRANARARWRRPASSGATVPAFPYFWRAGAPRAGPAPWIQGYWGAAGDAQAAEAGATCAHTAGRVAHSATPQQIRDARAGLADAPGPPVLYRAVGPFRAAARREVEKAEPVQRRHPLGQRQRRWLDPR